MIKLFCVSVNRFEERLIEITRTFPELNKSVVVCDKKLPKFFGNSNWVYLRGGDKKVEDESYHMNRVSDDNNFWYS